MTITAKIIEDSISEAGKRITTMQLCYPRFIHSEFLTHRQFSRNASSSRAIPVKKMIEEVRNNPAMPIHWGKNQAGMQAREECNNKVECFDIDTQEYDNISREAAWLEAVDNACDVAEAFSNAGYHKQIVNRLLEPFQHIHVVVTSTEWANFLALRYHEDAQPEIQELAKCMHEAMRGNAPVLLKNGEWHLPYITQDERKSGVFSTEQLCKISAARCARVSYMNHDGSKPDPDKDFELFDRLMGNIIKHASPTEHQATPLEDPEEQSGNFVGFLQFRKTIAGEYISEFKGPVE